MQKTKRHLAFINKNIALFITNKKPFIAIIHKQLGWDVAKLLLLSVLFGNVIDASDINLPITPNRVHRSVDFIESNSINAVSVAFNLTEFIKGDKAFLRSNAKADNIAIH